MNIVYYSRTGNTHHFVNEHLIPAMRLHPFRWPGDDNPRAVIEGPNPVQLMADSPSGEETGHYPPFLPGKSLVVFPIYAREDFETGEMRGTVPKCIQDFIERNRDNIVGAIAVGNRTFGRKYGYVNPEELYGVEHVDVVEMSGTRDEANRISDAIRWRAGRASLNNPGTPNNPNTPNTPNPKETNEGR